MQIRRSQLIFFGIIGLTILIIVGAQIVSGLGGDDDNNGNSDQGEGNAATAVTVQGFVGSEKVDFLRNPEVQRILRERYSITVDYTSLGSIAQVTEDSSGQDFLWPSNEVALALYEENNPGQVNAETIFNSPIVVYSWTPVVDALIDEGLVEVRNDIYYADTEELVNTFVTQSVDWETLGLDLFDGANITSTDPTKSNSGNMFYGLLTNILSEGNIATSATVGAVLPTLGEYYDRQGLMQTGSGDLFESFTSLGMGQYPIIVNYESLLIEFSLQNAANRDQILDEIRIIYPEPTVWSSHPLIALTDNGERLLEALQDEELQLIAWEQHGFRSGLINVSNNPDVLQVANIPATIDSVISLPRPEVMERMTTYLGNR